MTKYGLTPYSGFSSEITKTYFNSGSVILGKAVMISGENEATLYDGSKSPLGIAIFVDNFKVGVAIQGIQMYIESSETPAVGDLLYLQNDGTFGGTAVVGKEGLSVKVSKVSVKAIFYENNQRVEKSAVAIDYDFLGGVK